MIKAPYNFVPLAKDVFFPEWAESISQDIPFADGLSGTIEVTIQAETPVFVRNGHALDTTDNRFSHVVCNGKRQYFIPGTTVKGCIRNIMEIMSFGKMHPVTDTHTEKNYRHSPKQLEEERWTLSAEKQKKTGVPYDLAERIFGTTAGENSLRGRVQFTSFMCTKEVAMPERAKTFSLVLNTPDPSVLPIYVCQDGSEYIDYDDNFYPDDILKGWKRYVLRTGYWTNKVGKDNVVSTFMPLNKGSLFKGKIHYHNLREQELGALMCALMWHGEAGCFHQIGQAKPFGFGRISVSVDQATERKSKDTIAAFENMMRQWLNSMTGKPGWRHHWIMKELFALASTVIQWDDNRFKYISGQEFKKAKKNKEYLHDFTDIIKDEEV